MSLNLPTNPPTWEILPSHEDASVNHTLATPDGGHFEARFVQRTDEYFIIYLSSHSGCRHACRFCHLTATAQSMMTPANLHDFKAQTEQVLQTFSSQAHRRPLPQHVHVNFMARGEALSNPTLVTHSKQVYEELRTLIQQTIDIPVSFRVSTIFPEEFSGSLTDALNDPQAYPYYSLYSLNPTFRRRWLPKAMDPSRAFSLLKDFQNDTGREVILHWALIKDENDSLDDAKRVLEALDHWKLNARFNVVRYNPYSQARARSGRRTDSSGL